MNFQRANVEKLIGQIHTSYCILANEYFPQDLMVK